MEHVRTEKQGYAQQTYIVLLNEADLKRSDFELITMADRHCYDIPADEWKLIENHTNHSCHFGGNVEKKPGRRNKDWNYARITVYID